MKTIFNQKLLKARYNKAFFNRKTKNFIKFNTERFKNLKSTKYKENDGTILIDFFDHEPWNYFYSDIGYYLKNKFNFNLKYFHFILHKSFLSKFYITHRRLDNIYNSFECTKFLTNENLKIIKKKFIKKEYNKINSKKYLENYKFKKIIIGDLIYDTYLRTCFEPTINLKSKKFLEIFEEAIRIYETVDSFFKKNKIKLCIPSHTYYIQYGILVRLALHYGIPVIMIHSRGKGKRDLQLKMINKKNPREHNLGYEFYNKNFQMFQNKNKLINEGKKILTNRLSGHSKINYLSQSPYKGKIKSIVSNKEKVVIFCHDFFDSAHKFKSMIFPDFYEQLIFLINFIEKNTKYEIYLKIHPTHMKENDIIFEKIKKRFKGKVIFLSKNFNNYSIVKSKPKFVITNNGTITHEMAYFKIPVINTGDNPHINYKFSLNPKNLSELKKIILNIDGYNKKINFDKKKIFEFVYMHFVNPFKVRKRFNIDFEKRYNLNNFINPRKISSINKEYNKKVINYFDYFFKRIF